MKKLTKMGIDALRETLPVLSQEEQRGYMGMYNNDSFWRCISYLKTGEYSEAAAEVQALTWRSLQICGDYFTAHDLLSTGGAAVSASTAQEYMDSPLFTSSGMIAMDHSNPDSSGTGQCIVLLYPYNSQRDYYAFDPNGSGSFRVVSHEEFDHMTIIQKL